MEKLNWFSWWGLIFSTIFFSWIGAWVYLIHKGNKQAQRIKDTFPLTPYGDK